MMKKIVVALAMVPMLARADLAAGTFELSGGTNLGFSSGSSKVEQSGVSDTTDKTDYGLNTTGLYYVIPNLGVGLTLNYGYAGEKSPAGAKSSTSTFLVGPALGYELPVTHEVAVFGLGQVGYASSKLTEDGSPNVSASGFGFGVEAGAKYFLVKNFSFNAALRYEYQQVKTDETVKRTLTDSGFGLNVGLSVYFGGGEGHH
jgi:predicted porin